MDCKTSLSSANVQHRVPLMDLKVFVTSRQNLKSCFSKNPRYSTPNSLPAEPFMRGSTLPNLHVPSGCAFPEYTDDVSCSPGRKDCPQSLLAGGTSVGAPALQFLNRLEQQVCEQFIVSNLSHIPRSANCASGIDDSDKISHANFPCEKLSSLPPDAATDLQLHQEEAASTCLRLPGIIGRRKLALPPTCEFSMLRNNSDVSTERSSDSQACLSSSGSGNQDCQLSNFKDEIFTPQRFSATRHINPAITKQLTMDRGSPYHCQMSQYEQGNACYSGESPPSVPGVANLCRGHMAPIMTQTTAEVHEDETIKKGASLHVTMKLPGITSRKTAENIQSGVKDLASDEALVPGIAKADQDEIMSDGLNTPTRGEGVQNYQQLNVMDQRQPETNALIIPGLRYPALQQHKAESRAFPWRVIYVPFTPALNSEFNVTIPSGSHDCLTDETTADGCQEYEEDDEEEDYDDNDLEPPTVMAKNVRFTPVTEKSYYEYEKFDWEADVYEAEQVYTSGRKMSNLGTVETNEMLASEQVCDGSQGDCGVQADPTHLFIPLIRSREAEISSASESEEEYSQSRPIIFSATKHQIAIVTSVPKAEQNWQRQGSSGSSQSNKKSVRCRVRTPHPSRKLSQASLAFDVGANWEQQSGSTSSTPSSFFPHVQVAGSFEDHSPQMDNDKVTWSKFSMIKGSDAPGRVGEMACDSISTDTAYITPMTTSRFSRCNPFEVEGNSSGCTAAASFNRFVASQAFIGEMRDPAPNSFGHILISVNNETYSKEKRLRKVWDSCDYDEESICFKSPISSVEEFCVPFSMAASDSTKVGLSKLVEIETHRQWLLQDQMESSTATAAKQSLNVHSSSVVPAARTPSASRKYKKMKCHSGDNRRTVEFCRNPLPSPIESLSTVSCPARLLSSAVSAQSTPTVHNSSMLIA